MKPLVSEQIDGQDVWAAIVVRAHDAAWDGRQYSGSTLREISEIGALKLGIPYALIQEETFFAIAAQNKDNALLVLAALEVTWEPVPQPGPRKTHTPKETAAQEHRSYRWHLLGTHNHNASHGSESQHYAVPVTAVWKKGELKLWANSGRDHALIQEAVMLFSIPETSITLASHRTRPDQATFDAAIDAAIIARQVMRPIKVWPEQAFHKNESVISTSYIKLPACAGGQPAVGVTPGHPSAIRPSAAAIALLPTRPGTTFDPADQSIDISRLDCYGIDETYAPPTEGLRLNTAISHDQQVLAGLFARESYVDELAREAGEDPVQWRLSRLADPNGRSVVKNVADAANWKELARPAAAVNVQRGRGFAYATVVDESLDPPKQAWAAWVVDLSIHKDSGQLSLDKIVVGHHLDELVITDSISDSWRHSLTGIAKKLVDASGLHDHWTSATDKHNTAGGDITIETAKNAAPANRTRSVTTSSLSTSDAIMLPAAAAVANAIFDATGLRLREAPFGLALRSQSLHLANVPAEKVETSSTRTRPKPKERKRSWLWPLSFAGGIAGIVGSALPWRTEIPPTKPDLAIYSDQAIERGRLIAAAGDCVVCHTAPGGTTNAGGLAMTTPFGTIFSTNITPDEETGIGLWSFAAFDRAMREGVSRDGKHLYPAFPYTSFSKLSEGDMQALYAYLMVQPPVKSQPPATQLDFPYNVRPMMAYWNLLFHSNEPYVYNKAQSPLWNRGAYLVQGPGHCMACHSPRNAFGAEKKGAADFLSGGLVHDWYAPALNGTAISALPWTQKDLFDYLRTGFSERHGVAAGPMAPVIQNLQALPDTDIEAMAVYLDSLKQGVTSTAVNQTAEIVHEQQVFALSGKNIYEGACAACHDNAAGTQMFGVKVNLGLNSNVTAGSPDNLIRIILEGIDNPASADLGYMPGFVNELNDQQIADLLIYLRQQYAAKHTPWTDLPERIQKVREQVSVHTRAGNEHSMPKTENITLERSGERP